jgi:hypothetical protein
MFTREHMPARHRRLGQLWRTRHDARAIATCVSLLLILTACQPGAAQTPSGARPNATSATAAQTACEVRDFEATVLQGKDSGLTLQGTLIVQADATGRLTTRLTTKEGNTTRGSGQVTGRAINLEFDLGGGKHIFGTGTLDHDFADCTGALGGTFAGPDRADTGAWGCSCCPCYIRTISPTLGLEPLTPLRPAPAMRRGDAQEVALITGHLGAASAMLAP